MGYRKELSDMAALYTLPVLRSGVKAHYEGSIDKLGGNADWDWYLYQDENKEWVLFEYEGSGCLYNFVQHRYPCCTEPTFRIYIDGEKEPRYCIRHSEFGEKYPFTEPAASRYIGPYDNGRGPIRVVRSFVPVPFEKGMKITSDVKLAGNDRLKDEGGWGHVIFHAYSQEQKAFLGVKEADYGDLTDLFKVCGAPPIRFREGRREISSPFTLAPGEEKIIFSDAEGGMVSGIQLRTRDYDRAHLQALTLSAYWDEAGEKPDLSGNFGCIFHNELGYHGVHYLLAGMSADGEYYHYYPMPYERCARICIANHGDRPVHFEYAAVDYTREWNEFYQTHPFGYFRSSEYYTRKHTEGADSVIARIRGNGQIVGSIITGFGQTPDSRADCEGDVRIYIDGNRTPQIESDGSESYSCYGWGFETPPEYNPVSGYDGHAHKDWSMTRLLLGDWYPFLSEVRFQIESGGCNDCYMEHSGMVFYYGRDEERLYALGEIRTGDAESERENEYTVSGAKREEISSYFEGDEDDILITATGYRFGKGGEENGNMSRDTAHTEEREAGSSFVIRLTGDPESVILRRMSDQSIGRQRASVWVDGERLPKAWYVADRNEVKRWLEDEYVIPEQYLKGKEAIRVRIIPEGNGISEAKKDAQKENRSLDKPEILEGGNSSECRCEESRWNEFGYRIYGCRRRTAAL